MMVSNKTCCVTGCKTASKNALFFKVPAMRSLRRRWTDAIKPATTITLDSYICNAHFLTTDYESVRGKTRLKRRVVPSIFDNGGKIKSLKLKEIPSEELPENNENSKTIANIENNEDNTETDEANTETNEDNTESNEANTKIPDTSASNTGHSNKGVSNKKVSDTGVADEGDNNKLTENSNDKVMEVENGCGNESPKSKETSQITKTSDTVTSAKVPENDSIILDDQTGALTNSVGADITPPCTVSTSERAVTTEKCITKKPLKPISPMPDMNKDDIEEILTNYHIKQTKPLHETYEDFAPEEDVVDLADIPESEPVFIEISVDKDRNADTSANDCLMLLESVQVDIDPSSLMLPERTIEEVDGVIGDDDDDDDDDVQETATIKKKEDPISLLTSSDEDDVIIEEPDIATVSVSDETDEDDVPLVRLLRSSKDTRNKMGVERLFWGGYDYYCMECHFTSYNRAEFENHRKQHSTVLQICQLCGYTTASEGQFSRHKKKHKEEKKYKCHLCDYKAKHNMSLTYHLKTHKETKCTCGFKSKSSSKIIKHLKVCLKKFSCDQCSYGTRRRSDLKRHKRRKHKDSDDDDDEDSE